MSFWAPFSRSGRDSALQPTPHCSSATWQASPRRRSPKRLARCSTAPQTPRPKRRWRTRRADYGRSSTSRTLAAGPRKARRCCHRAPHRRLDAELAPGGDRAARPNAQRTAARDLRSPRRVVPAAAVRRLPLHQHLDRGTSPTHGRPRCTGTQTPRSRLAALQSYSSTRSLPQTGKSESATSGSPGCRRSGREALACVT